MFFIRKLLLYRKITKFLEHEFYRESPVRITDKFLNILKLEDEEYYDDDDYDEASYPCEASLQNINQFLNDNYSDITFSKKLTLYMHERDITTSLIYKRSFIDRKLISKICTSDNYHPSKQTVFALCIALRLNLKESEEFLTLAEYSFSCHKKYDLIIKFLLDNQVYDIDVINDILFHFEQPCFGQ